MLTPPPTPPRLSSPDERVSIPLPEEASAFSDKWSRARSPRAKPVARNWEDEWLENYKPPEVASNRFVLAATRCVTTIGTLLYFG